MRSAPVPHDVRIKTVTADVDATFGNHVATAVGIVDGLGLEFHDGKIRGATTKVGYEHQLFFADLPLVSECGPDGLHLKIEGIKAGNLHGLGQAFLSQLILFRVFIKNHGAANHGCSDVGAQKIIGLFF